MMVKKTLHDEMKDLESVWAKQALNENSPFCVRIDGKKFSSFTRKLKKPFDERFTNAMIETMNFLVEQTHANLGYTQSDEITLVFFKNDEKEQYLLGARVQKLTSILASMAAAKFNSEIQKNIEEKKDMLAFFDARAWSVPTLKDCEKVIIWRQEDAIKNSISMATSSHYSHKDSLKKTSTEKKEMLKQKGFSWEDLDEKFKSGTFVKKITVEKQITEDLKKFKNNEDKEVFLRSELINFNIPRLKDLSDEKVFEYLFGKKDMREENGSSYKIRKLS